MVEDCVAMRGSFQYPLYVVDAPLLYSGSGGGGGGGDDGEGEDKGEKCACVMRNLAKGIRLIWIYGATCRDHVRMVSSCRLPAMSVEPATLTRNFSCSD